jgi:hypothetical protein
MKGLEPVIKTNIENKPKKKPVKRREFPGSILDYDKYWDQGKEGDEPESILCGKTGKGK